MIQNTNINNNSNWNNDGCGGCCLFVCMLPIFVVIFAFFKQVAAVLAVILPYLAIALLIGVVVFGVLKLKGTV